MKRVHAASLAADGGHGELMATGPTSLVNAKQKLLRSQSFFWHTSPRPTNFQCCLAQIALQ